MSSHKPRYFAMVYNHATGVWEDSGLPQNVLETLAGEVEQPTCYECGQPLTEAEIDECDACDEDIDTWLCDACAFIPENGRCRHDP